MLEEKTYELTYLISSRLDENAIQMARADIDSLINGIGEIIKSEGPKDIALAYPIKKEKRAFLGVIMFRAEKKKVLEVKRKLDKENKILRFLLISKENTGKMYMGVSNIGKAFGKPEERPRGIEKPKRRKKVDLKQIETELEGIAKGKL